MPGPVWKGNQTQGQEHNCRACIVQKQDRHRELRTYFIQVVEILCHKCPDRVHPVGSEIYMSRHIFYNPQVACNTCYQRQQQDNHQRLAKLAKCLRDLMTIPLDNRLCIARESLAEFSHHRFEIKCIDLPPQQILSAEMCKPQTYQQPG